MTLPVEIRILRALSGAARAERDAHQLARDLGGHQSNVALEISGELAYQTRRLAYLARLRGIAHDQIESAVR